MRKIIYICIYYIDLKNFFMICQFLFLLETMKNRHFLNLDHPPSEDFTPPLLLSF